MGVEVEEADGLIFGHCKSMLSLLVLQKESYDFRDPKLVWNVNKQFL